MNMHALSQHDLKQRIAGLFAPRMKHAQFQLSFPEGCVFLHLQMSGTVKTPRPPGHSNLLFNKHIICGRDATIISTKRIRGGLRLTVNFDVSDDFNCSGIKACLLSGFNNIN